MTQVTRGTRIGVVVPALNEARELPRVLRAIPASVSAVYVVDDGSTDDTYSAARSVPDPRIRVLRHERNGGLGTAMRTGYRASIDDGCDVIVKLDADGQMDPAEIERLVLPISLGLAEYVKGNRFRHAARLGDMPGTRRFGNVMLSLLTKVASGYWHVFDSQCGFTAVLAHTLEAAGIDGIADDYFFENDMLVRLSGVGARVVDVPVTVTYADEVSHIRIWRIVASFPLRLAMGWGRRVLRQHVLWDFGAVGALGLIGLPCVIFGVVFGAYHWVSSILENRPASTGTVMIAVLPIVVGVQMLLQALLIEVENSPGASETKEFARILSRTPVGGSAIPECDGPVRDAF